MSKTRQSELNKYWIEYLEVIAENILWNRENYKPSQFTTGRISQPSISNFWSWYVEHKIIRAKKQSNTNQGGE